MTETLTELRAVLASHADEKARESGRRYFREPVEMYGIKAAVVRDIARSWFKSLGNVSKAEVFALCDELWQSGMMEESFIACFWSHAVKKHYTPDDFERFERWVGSYLANWASCDTLCNHTIGDFLVKYPVFVERLYRWTASPNRWMRRAAAVSLIIPVRKGMFLTEILGIATLLLDDADDMVQKGYGWMLKSASQAHQQEVFNFVMSHRNEMPRTALRYAIEKMPAELKVQAMKRD